MSLLREIEWEPCLLEPVKDPALTSELRRRHGRVASPIAYFYPCRELCDALTALNNLHLSRVEVDHTLLDMVGAVVSQDQTCRFCYAAQRAVLRATGFSEERIRELARDIHTADLSPRERAVLDFARRLSRSHPLLTRGDARRLESESGLTDFQVKEIAAAVCLSIFFNRVSTLPALPPEPMEKLPDRWYARLFRPVFRRYVDSLRTTAPRTYLADEQKSGAFSPVVCALDGLPVAPRLRELIDALLSGDGLPLRSKALVFAVVGRALSCDASEAEGSRLAVQGGVEPAVVEEVLDHLTSPALTEVERLLVPLARETVWYQPAPLQRRAREARDALELESFIEFVVAAATANTVCRLGSVVVDR